MNATSTNAPLPGATPVYSVEIRDLVKKFGTFVAVDHVSMAVEKGEIFGFLGPNGVYSSSTASLIRHWFSPGYNFSFSR